MRNYVVPLCWRRRTAEIHSAVLDSWHENQLQLVTMPRSVRKLWIDSKIFKERTLLKLGERKSKFSTNVQYCVSSTYFHFYSHTTTSHAVPEGEACSSHFKWRFTSLINLYIYIYIYIYIFKFFFLTWGTPSQLSAKSMASRAFCNAVFGDQLFQSGHRPADGLEQWWREELFSLTFSFAFGPTTLTFTKNKTP